MFQYGRSCGHVTTRFVSKPHPGRMVFAKKSARLLIEIQDFEGGLFVSPEYTNQGQSQS